MESQNCISFTKVSLPYGWLGNMSPYPIEYAGKTWRTTEALFQAMRFDNVDLQEMIRLEKGPMGAKMKAKGMADRMAVKQLSEKDVSNMETCVRLKLEQHPNLMEELLNTGDLPIYEDVTKRGNRGSNLFWGAMLVDGVWQGQNVLGNIWMKLRQEIRDRN
jgi:predicted NAD-dependent protein-ADP-ribosyltransferase YbiA (DUF1768 family)